MSPAARYALRMRRLPPLLLALLFSACASPASRIKKNRAAFDSWPPAVQAAVREGRADVGFTKEQVETALGKPDRVYTRKEGGAEQEVWSWGTASPRTGVGFGVGIGSRGGYGGGIGVGTGDGYAREESARVVFQGGSAISVESRKR